MTKRVAVIAVHGVGGPQRNSTARAIADLLVRHQSTRPPTAIPPYGQFSERCITIPTAPLGISRQERRRSSDARGGTEPIDESVSGGLKRLSTATMAAPGRITNLLGKMTADRTSLASSTAHGDPPDVAFMRKQIEQYPGSFEPYDTIELVGSREGGGRGDRVDVHIYEMYWADLSRVGSGVFSLLGAIYQLVLHIGNLGRKALDIGASVAATDPGTFGPSRPWALYARAQARAVRIFTLIIPVATLVTLMFLTLFLPAAVPAPDRLGAGLVITGLLVLFATGFALYFRTDRPGGASKLVAAISMLVTEGICAYFSPPVNAATLGTYLLTIDAVAIVVGVYALALHRYGRSRPAALAYGLVHLAVVVVLTVATLGRVVAPEPAERVRQLGLYGFQWAFAIQLLTWLALWWSIAIVVVRRSQLWMATRRPSEGGPATIQAAQRAHLRASRASWTARVTLAGSLLSFILGALLLGGVLLEVAWNQRAHFDVFPQRIHHRTLPLVPLIGDRLVNPGFTCPPTIADVQPSAGKQKKATRKQSDEEQNTDDACLRSFFTALLAESGTSGMVIALAGIGVAGILVSWFIVLIAATSVRVPDPKERSEELGQWMTDGFRWLRWAGEALVVGAGVGITVGVTSDILSAVFRRSPAWFEGLASLSLTTLILHRLTLIVIASSATFLAAWLRVASLATRARPALGVILDVDTYLREVPETGTPRARIAERFASLLRYVTRASFPGSDQPMFDQIVLVSHSQGTVITADFLRFVACARPHSPVIDPSRVRLMTMGSPLRQLYAENFPHLYRWVDYTDDIPVAEGVDPRVPLPLAHRSPDPASLGVGGWVNLYTTGDYIGRSLWRSDRWCNVWEPEPFTPGFRAHDGARKDRCLGAGTHTHYWTSLEVAKELDDLIARPS